MNVMDKMVHLRTFSWGLRNTLENLNLSWCRQHLRCESSTTKSSTIKSRLDFFNSKASKWWDSSDRGSMSHLSLMNPLRIHFVCEQLQSRGLTVAGHKPLTGLHMVDVGCGAGVLTEKLAQLGAQMTGVDPAESAVEAAKLHASSCPNMRGRVEYLVSTPEDHAKSFGEKYDVAIVFLVLEHIQHRSHFIDSCLQLLKPNGSLFIMHANQTYLNWFLHCFWVPYILKVYDKNLLKYNRFLRANEILDILYKANCRVVATQGFRFNWIGRGMSLTKSHKYGIILHALKSPK